MYQRVTFGADAGGGTGVGTILERLQEALHQATAHAAESGKPPQADDDRDLHCGGQPARLRGKQGAAIHR